MLVRKVLAGSRRDATTEEGLVKSKVAPLIRMLSFREREAGAALGAAEHALRQLEREKEVLQNQQKQSEQRFDHLQGQPTVPEEHLLHQRWLERLQKTLSEKDQALCEQRQVVDECRESLAELHKELKTIERYQQGLIAQRQEELKSLEAKELDEIAGQKHRRQKEAAEVD